MAQPIQELTADNLVKLVEALETIKVTPERIKKNKTYMGDNNGGLVEF